MKWESQRVSEVRVCFYERTATQTGVNTALPPPPQLHLRISNKTFKAFLWAHIPSLGSARNPPFVSGKQMVSRKHRLLWLTETNFDELCKLATSPAPLPGRVKTAGYGWIKAIKSTSLKYYQHHHQQQKHHPHLPLRPLKARHCAGNYWMINFGIIGSFVAFFFSASPTLNIFI